jgi:cell division septation protein DedD
MRPFDHHIYSLLLRHDCVVIPDFGGFIATRENARIDSVRQQGLPPARKIAFNVYLRNHDGLLAKLLVETEQVSYPQALQEIEQYVASITKSLESGERIVIRKVGQLQFDADRNIQFEPDTKSFLLPEAFGLSSLPVHVLSREKESLRNQRGTSPGKKSSKDKNRSLVSILAVIGAVLWFSLNVYLVSKDDYNQAGMNPLDVVNHEKQQVTDQKIAPPAPTVVKVETVYVAPTPPDSVVSLNPSTAGELKQKVNSSPSTNTTLSYFAIAGVFKSRDNAENLVRSLQNEGFTQAAIIENKSKMFYVSASGFADKTEAKTWMNSAGNNDRNFWVFHR